MAWQPLSDHTEIRGIFDTIIRKGASIEVHFPGDEEVFFTRALGVSSLEKGPPKGSLRAEAILLRDLSPRRGNDRIRNSDECEILFSFRSFLCRFRSTVLSEPEDPPHPGHLIEYPAVMDVEEKRREERFFPGSPGFYCAAFSYTDRNRETRNYELRILNFSRHGLGLLISERDFPLLQLLQPGDPVEDLTLYGEAVLVRLSAVVRHKSEIEEGPFAGGYVLGLRAEASLEEQFDALSMGSLDS
jgi:hypothetical protein